MITYNDIVVRVTTVLEGQGLGKARTAVKDFADEADAASGAFTELERKLSRIDKKSLALEYDAASVDALIADLDTIDESLQGIQKRKLTIDPSVRSAAGELRAALKERQMVLEAEAARFKEIQEEETKYQERESKRRTTIARLEAKVKDETASAQHKGALTRLKALSDAEAQQAAQRQRLAKERAPDLFRELKGAARDVDRVGRALVKTDDAAASWGSKFDSLSGILTRLTPIMRGLALVIGVTLASAFSALLASITAAAGAIAAMATSFVAVLGPMVALAIGFFSRLAAVTQVLAAKQNVLKAANKATATAEADAAKKAEAMRNARNTLRDATEAGVAAERTYKEAIRQAKEEIADAADRQISAAAELASANRNLASATVDAYREIRDAAEDASDAVRDLEGAQLDLEGAQIDTKKARRDLKEFRSEAGLLGSSFDDIFKKFEDVDVDISDLIPDLQGAGADLGGDQGASAEDLVHRLREAKHREAEATDRVSDSERDLNDKRAESNRLNKTGIAGVESYASAVERQRDASKDLQKATAENNRLQKQGVENNPAVIAALDGMRDAKQREKEATKDLTAVRKGEVAGIVALNGAMEDYQFQLGQLSPAEQAFVEALAPFASGLKKVVQEGTDPIFDSLTKVIPQLGQFAPLVGGMFKGMGASVGKGIENFFALLANPVTKANLVTIGLAAQRLLDTLATKAVGAAFTAFINVAVAAMPLLERFLNGVVKGLEGFSKQTQGMDANSGFFGIMVDSAMALWDVIKNVAKAFVAFVEAGAQSGNSLLKFLGDGAKAMAKFLGSKKGQERLKKFFDDTMPFAKSLVRFLIQLGKVGVKAFELLAPVAEGFLDGLTFIFKGFEELIDILLHIPAPIRKILGIVLSLVAAFLGFGGTITAFGWRIATGLVTAIITGLGAIIEGIKKWGKDVVKAFEDFIGWVKDAFGIGSPSKVFIDIGKDLIRGLINGVKAMAGFIGDAAKWLGRKVLGGFKAALAAVKKLGGTIYAWLRDGLGTIWAKLVSLGGTILGKLVAGFKAVRQKVVDLAMWVYNRVKNGVSAIYEKFKSIGKSIIDGLLAGINAAKQTVEDAMKGVAQGIIDTVVDVLSIGSPSKVMERLGKDTMLGFAKGIKTGQTITALLVDQLGAKGMKGIADMLSPKGTLWDFWGKDHTLDLVKQATYWDEFKAAKGKLQSKEAARKHLKIPEGPIAAYWSEGHAGTVLNPITVGPQIAWMIVKDLLRGHGALSKDVRGLASGGVVTGEVFRRLGEAGKEAVLPLNRNVMGSLARAITAQMQMAGPGVPGAPGAGRGVVIEHQTVVLPPAPGHDQMGDPRFAALQFAREMSKRGDGAPA